MSKIEELIKSEIEIKELLKKTFEGVGNFQRCEFSTRRMSSRPDFVILGDDFFTYYEIKTELDTFERLEYQFGEANGLFTEMYLVIPRCKLERAIPIVQGRMGVYLIEELYEGIKRPYIKAPKMGSCTIHKVVDLLWSDDRKDLVGRLDIFYNQKRLDKDFLGWKASDVIQLFYDNSEALKILNEFLPKRNYV